MKNNDMSFSEKLNDILGDIQCRIQLVTGRRSFPLIFAVCVVIIVALLFALLASGTPKPEPVDFPYEAAAGFEDNKVTLKDGKVTVELRISDIRTIDIKDRGKEYQTSTVYTDEFSMKRIYADLIITNNSKEDISFGGSNNNVVLMGYTLNNSPKHAKDDFLQIGTIYNREENKRAPGESFTAPAKNTSTVTLTFDVFANSVNRMNTLLFCGEYFEGAGEKYEIAGVGQPFLTYRFTNSDLFPVLSIGEEELIADSETAATEPVRKISHSARYGWDDLGSDSSVLRSFNDENKGSFQLSLEISAEGSSSTCTNVKESGYSAAISSAAIVGKIPEIIYADDKEFEKMKLCFKIDPSLKKNTLGTYAEVSDEFRGIRRLNVFMFDEEINMLLPIETFFDEAQGIVEAETNRPGTYCLIDMELWLNELGISPEDSN